MRTENIYRMAQNFDGGNFDESGLGNFLRVKNLRMLMVQLIVMLTARAFPHADPLVICIYSYVARKSLIPVCMHMHLHVHQL